MIAEYLSYSFVRHAFIAGVLTALCSSLLGVTLVLKRYSFIGDGLSHVAFGAMAIAAVLSIKTELIVVLPVTVLCAVLLLKTGTNARIKGDAALSMLSVGSNRATTKPRLSVRNLVKFHLMSGFWSYSASSFLSMSSRI